MFKTDGNRMIPILSILVSILILEPLSFRALIHMDSSQDIALNQDNNWGFFLDSIEKNWLIYVTPEKTEKILEDNYSFKSIRDRIVLPKMLLYLNFGLVIYLIRITRPKNKNISNAIPLGGHAPPNVVVIR